MKLKNTFLVAAILTGCANETTSVQKEDDASEPTFTMTATSSTHEADANVCGDINFLTTYDLENIPVGPYGDAIIDRSFLDVVQAALLEEVPAFYDVPSQLIVTNAWDQAASLVTRSFDYDADRNELMSCHDLSALEAFDLEIDGDQLTADIDWEEGEEYLTLGLLPEGGVFAAEYTIHFYLNVEKKKAAIFLIW